MIKLTEEQEQLIRIARIFGNGAHLIIPKEWAGEQLVITRQPEKSLKNRIIGVLSPYLDKIIGAYVYGSYARGEQKEDSDIDLLVITNERIKIKKKGFEIICVEEKMFDKSIKLAPLLIYSVLSEAKPIINSALLKSLKEKYKPKKFEFNEFISETKRLIKINEGSLVSQDEYLSGDAEIYSLVLRLRGIFFIKKLFKKEKYTFHDFKVWIKKNLSGVDFDLIYNAYRKSKINLKIKEKIKKQDLIALLNFLKKETFTF